MTRKEAIKKCDSALFLTDSKADNFVSALEALGLIKFDKEQAEMFYDSSNDCYSLPWLQNLVKAKGYKIVKSS